METFSTDIRAILEELNQSECQADELISGFKKGFDEVIQRYVLSRNTPAKPSKKKAKGRIEKLDSHDDSFSSTNSSRSTSTITQTGTLNNAQSTDDEPSMMRPVRTGRAKATCYKEPPLNAKMRRDGTMTVVNVKVERLSKDDRTERSKIIPANTSPVDVDIQPTSPVRIKKEKNDEKIPTKSKTTESTKSSSEATNRSKKSGSDDLNDSLVIVPIENTPTIELSDDENANGNDVTKMPPPSFVPPAKTTKEKKAPVERKVRPTRSKQSKRKIKQEPVSENEDECEPCPSKSTANKTNIAKTTEEEPAKSSRSTTAKSKTNRTQKMSGESLYEDAVSQTTDNITDDKPQLSQQSDATFVTTADDADIETLSPRGTYIIEPKNNAKTNEASDATFDAENQSSSAKRVINDQTVVLKAKPVNKPKASGGSIMTEDDSDSDTGIRKPSSSKSKKDPKELFNPLASKPIKQRVEAFEKLQTPQKEIRTRSRIMTAESEKAKATHGSLFSKGTSSEQSGKHVRAVSASRYAQSTQKAVLSKSQSVEEIRKKAQAVVDEKKKKQDDKLRKAQQMREAQEKEKAEKQRKLLQEKEQRSKEKAQQKMQEDLMRVQEQKRREAEREQKRKEMIARKAAADRKEQENYLRVLAQKKAMQEQLNLNKMKAEETRKKNAYNFDMLESGDSTDDEGKTSSKRPTPPTWSMSQNRHAFVIAQARVSAKITDKFFSVAPHEVDLREIFPRIDEKYLRRNSSAVWNSPPRYSQLPKY